jgi:ABC-type multidrug transport system permease subunit
MVLKRIVAIMRLHVTESLRDATALGSAVLLPLFIILAFYLAIAEDDAALFTLGIYGEPEQVAGQAGKALDESLFGGLAKMVRVDNLEQGVDELRRQKLDILLDPSSKRFIVCDWSIAARVVERMLTGTRFEGFRREVAPGPAIRYVDWLVPGILAMNVLFIGSYGVVYSVVRYRRDGVLMRLRATPVAAMEFVCGQLLARILLVVATTLAVFLVIEWVVRVPILGSYIDLAVMLCLGATCLTSLGLMVAAWTESEELAVNILNVLSWAMMLFSGIWFSIDNLSPGFGDLTMLLPMTHFIEASREIMLYGVGILDTWKQALVLVAMSLAFLSVGVASFRWN